MVCNQCYQHSKKKPLEQNVSPRFWVVELAGVSRPGNQ
jgi:hypothetical protein